MKKIVTKALLSITVILTFNANANNNINYTDGFKPKAAITLSFTENKGQVHDQNYSTRPDVLFGGTDGNLVFHLKNNGVSYQLNQVDNWKEVENERTKQKREKIDQSTFYRLDVNWLNCNTNATIIKGKVLEGYDNYYLENCPNGALNVRSFEDVTYQNIYRGIDLKWYQKDGHLKYDYVVAAGANYKNIQLEIKGATSIKLNNKGELVIKTPLGEIIEQAPFVVQNGNILDSKWLVKINDSTLTTNIVSFDIENINPTQPFIIDPAIRVWGTYYGGVEIELYSSCNTDPSGNVYLAGITTSNTTIATVGSYQTVLGGGVGSENGYLVKFNTLGVRQWGTYYGGSGPDNVYSCSTDPSGNVYLTGVVVSTIGIATVGSHQATHGGGGYDAFLVKFNTLGVRQWGTYYGGGGVDVGFSCSTDASGNVYLAGKTDSNTGTAIATVGSHQATHAGGVSLDAFLVKFNGLGVRQWGTYYGGIDSDVGYSCSTDASGNVYLAGYSNLNTGTAIATIGSHQSVSGGGYDAFLVQFNTLGVRQWGTYYGGSGSDGGESCNTDASGNVYLAGYTDSNLGTVIATAGSHQAIYGGGGDDAFLVKFNSLGVRQWSTYYGGNGYDAGYFCSTDASGNVYLAGYTDSNTGTDIATVGSHQAIYSGGVFDAFLVQFNTLGVRQWGTYYGGSGVDIGQFCSTDASGSVYLSGHTDSNTGTDIATVGSHQAAYGGGTYDAFLVKFAPDSLLADFSVSDTTICVGTCVNFIDLSTGIPTSWNWTFPGGTPVNSIQQHPTICYNAAGVYDVTLIASNGNGSDSITKTLYINVLASPISTDIQTTCNSLIWLDGITYNASTNTPTFTIVGGAANGCDSVITLDLTINTFASGTDVQTECNSLTWLDGITYNASTNTPTFTIVGGAASGCDSVVTLNLTITTFASGTDVQAACNSLTWIDGINYTASTNTPKDTLVAANGCDSIVTLNLTINTFASGNDVIISCMPITWIDGNTYSASTTSPIFTIVGGSFQGCDSIVTLNLTINSAVTDTDIITSCTPITWIDGNNYSASTTTPTFTIVGGSVQGCDSVVTLNLTINSAVTGTDVITSCSPITWIDGNNYTASTTTPTFTIVGGAANGCDSVVNLDLTITTPTKTTNVLTKCEGFSITVGSNTYTSTGVYTDIINNCDTIITNLTINPAPQLTLIKTDDNCGENKGSIVADVVSSNPPVTYIWNTGSTDLTISNLPSGTYSVIVNDGSGCAKADTIDVVDLQIDCPFFVYIPNMFSPNGDGQNDVFFVRGKGIATLSVKIYNRWGNKVFEINDVNQGWDGAYKGSEQNTAVFVFVLEATFLNGKTVSESGDVSLIR